MNRERKRDVDDRFSTLTGSTKRKNKKNGIRNSNCVALAPTATISNIVGVSASIEPTFQNLYVKSNLSGEFTMVSEMMVRISRELGFGMK